MYAFLHQISPDVCYFYSEFHGPWRLGDRWGPLGMQGFYQLELGSMKNTKGTPRMRMSCHLNEVIT